MPDASPRRRRTFIAAVTVAALATTAGPAMAAQSDGGCTPAPVSNPFMPWGDSADYQLAPGGDVEDAGASWTTRGGAAAVEGNESYFVGGAGDHMSMGIPPSGSAMTDEMCIGAEHPTFRFFVKRSGGSAFSRLLAEVVVAGRGGRERSIPVGLVGGSGSWAPTYVMPTLVSLLAERMGGTIDAAFRFSALGGGTWSVDDVYVDPVRGT